MTVRIVTDSTADLPVELVQQLGIKVVPLYVHFGDEVYRDGVDLGSDEFYEKLTTTKALPTTSTISPGDVANVYDELARETDEVLAITISSELSATYEAALQGKDLMKSKKCRVEVIDSRYVTMALGLIVLTAAKQAQSGSGLDEVVQVTRSAISRVKVRMAFDTLEYVRRGGRIGAAQAFMGNLLNLKPILTLKDGVATPVARERTRTKAICHLRKFASECPRVDCLAVAHANTPDEAENLVKTIETNVPRDQILLARIGAVMGTHLGPGALGTAFIESET